MINALNLKAVNVTAYGKRNRSKITRYSPRKEVLDALDCFEEELQSAQNRTEHNTTSQLTDNHSRRLQRHESIEQVCSNIYIYTWPKLHDPIESELFSRWLTRLIVCHRNTTTWPWRDLRPQNFTASYTCCKRTSVFWYNCLQLSVYETDDANSLRYRLTTGSNSNH